MILRDHAGNEFSFDSFRFICYIEFSNLIFNLALRRCGMHTQILKPDLGEIAG